MVSIHSSSLRHVLILLLLLAGTWCCTSSGEKGGGESVSNRFNSILDNVDDITVEPRSAFHGIIDITTKEVDDNDNDDDHKSSLSISKKPNEYNRKRTRIQPASAAASNWVQRGGDTNPLVGTSDFDKFGAASSLSANGLVLAVGAPYSNGGGAGQDSGSVQVYEYVDGNSYQPRGPAINGTEMGDTFGWAVSLSNDGAILAVGAPKSSGKGYVKIYKYNGEKYDEVISLSVSDFGGELFGYSISLSGDGKTLAIGQPKGFTTGGFVKLYSIDADTGGFTYPETAYPEDFYGNNFPYTELGYSVSISNDGNVLAAGDSLLSEVQVHQFDGLQFELVCTMLGEAVSLSGDGTRFAVRNQTSAIVSVYSIDAAKAECLQLGQSIPISTSPSSSSSDTYDPSGSLLSLSNDGHVLAVANPLNTNGVQVYEEKYNSTEQLEYVTKGDAITIVNSTSVSLSDDGSVLAIGVPFQDLGNGQFEDNGSMLVYEWPSQTMSDVPTPPPTPDPTQPITDDPTLLPTLSPTLPPTFPPTTPSPTIDIITEIPSSPSMPETQPPSESQNDTSDSSWVQRGDGNLLVGTSDFDMFCAASSLSANGLVLAVGAPHSNGGAAGEDSGSVQVYDYTDGISYQPRGPAINGTNSGDVFGWSVSLSNNGEILAVGAPKSNGIGYVKIYKYDGEKYNELINISESGFVGELFGFSISLAGDGKTLAIGKPLDAVLGGTVTLYSIYAETNTSSTFPYKIYGDSMFYSELGYSVSVSDDGNVLAAVDRYFSEVQVHQISQEQLVCTVPGEAFALSGDGTRFAVRNQTSAIVRVFYIDAAGEECLQIGQSIPVSTSPPPSSSDSYAMVDLLLSLSYDGHVLAVANPLNTNGVQMYEEKYNATGQLEYVPIDDAITIVNLTAVSLSNDGRVLAIGVPFRDLGNGQFQDNGCSTLVYEQPSKFIVPTPTLIPSVNDTPEPSWIQRGDANLVGISDFDNFGAASCLSANGLVLAVGASYSNDGGAGLDSGSVQVYDYADGNSYKPRGPAIRGTNTGDTFGWSVSLSNDGEILAVGSPGKGYVKIYKYDGEKYNEVIYLSSAGYSISLSGDGKTLAIGAPKYFGNRGTAELYSIDATAGTASTLDVVVGSNNFTSNELGYSVSISDDGNVLAAGDSLLSEVQVYLFDGSSYQLVCMVPGEAVSLSGDGTRFAVRIQSSTIVSVYAAGVECLQLGQSIPIAIFPLSSSDSYAPSESLISLSNDGHVLAVVNPINAKGVQVYEERYNTTGHLEYVPRGDAIAIANTNSTAVSLSDDGKVLAIGTQFRDLGNGQFEDNGSTFVYAWPSQTISLSPISTPTVVPTSMPNWVQRGDANLLVGTSDFGKFGAASCLSSNGLVLAVGAPYSNGGGAGLDSGSVQVYEYVDGSSYQPRGPVINGTAYGDTFGWSVSLSNNGEILAVGAPKSNGIGYVKIYKYDGEKYNEAIHLSEGEFAGELFGYSISLSGDGTSLVIGTPLGFINGGYVAMYSIDADTGGFTYPETSEPQYFYSITELGYSVSISDDGNVLAAGDSLLSEVQVYQFDESWYQLICTMLGEAVSLSGDGTRFAVRNQTSAIVSVFSINAAKAECLQIGQSIPITISPPSFSYRHDPTISMSLSNDGHVLAVVNPLKMNGVQVYEEKYNANGQLEYVPRDAAISISNSTSVSLSDDGMVLAIGVPFRDLGNGQFEDNGSTLVYEWPLQSRGGTSTPQPVPDLTPVAIDDSTTVQAPPSQSIPLQPSSLTTEDTTTSGSLVRSHWIGFLILLLFLDL